MPIASTTGVPRSTPTSADSSIENVFGVVASMVTCAHPSGRGDRLDVLTTLVDAYERKIHPIGPPDPIEAIKHTMDARNLTNKDLETILNSRRERVWEIMHYKRPLSLTMIRRLNREIGIPAEVLIQSYGIENNARA